MNKTKDFLRQANTILDEASALARQYFRTPLDITLKEGVYPVTQADKEIEMLIREKIQANHSDHDILGEEYGLTNCFSGYLWVIDPVDGTTAFAAGKPTFTVLLALYKEGKPMFGIIDQPILKERWIGIIGEKTYFNQLICRGSLTKDLSSARLNCTTPEMFDHQQQNLFKRLRQQVASVSYGGDAYAYGLLAAGYIDLVMEADLKFYDVAALVPIIEGAGGVITDWQGGAITRNFDGTCLAAANPELHRQALEIICDEI